MGKFRTQKTKKAVTRRFKTTATGKLVRSKAGRRHLLGGKSAKRKRHLAKQAVVSDALHDRVMACLPFGA